MCILFYSSFICLYFYAYDLKPKLCGGITLSTALNLVHRNSFPKISDFPWYFTQLCKFSGGATFEMHADLENKNRNSQKSRANSRNLLEPFLRSRKEENFYGHCAINNARRILSKGSTLLRSCYFWSKKLHFQKNFGRNFNAVERVTNPKPKGANVKNNKYKDVYGIVHKAFAPAIVGMSGQIHADFLRLLWVSCWQTDAVVLWEHGQGG